MDKILDARGLDISESAKDEAKKLQIEARSLPGLIRKAEANQKRYRQEQAKRLSELHGISKDEALSRVPMCSISDREKRRIKLDPNHLLWIEGKWITAGVVFARPEEFDGISMADPIEGPEYGTSTAKYFGNLESGVPVITSLAHGECVNYFLDADPLPSNRDKDPSIRGENVGLKEEDEDHRPALRYSAGELHSMIKLTCSVLSDQNPPNIFQRSSSLVRVAHAPARLFQDGIDVPLGAASIHLYKPATLSLELSRIIRFESFSEKNQEWRPTDPFPKLLSTLLDAYGHWEGVPVLRGISEAPLLRKDGTLQSTPGYDSETGLYVEGRVPPITLPETVTQENALEAMEVALSPFREFPFVHEDLGKACVLAYLFTLLLRPLIATAPMFIFSATTPGTGKGLMVEAANTIASGHDAAIMPPVRGKDGQEEMRKRLTSVIVHGMTSVCIDNCSQPLGGDAINALLTTTEWTDRKLGSNEITRLPVCLTLSATGNNLGVRGDMVRRSIVVQLDAKTERPEQRTFDEPDLVEMIRTNRVELLKALFTILKGFQQSGCTDFSKDRLGRFEEWSERVCHPIQWLGLPNPTDSQMLLREEDPESEALQAVLTTWYAVHGDRWIATKDLTSYERISQSSEEDCSALREALFEVASTRGDIDTKRLGWYLKRNLGRVVGSYRLDRKDKAGRRGNHGHQYRVVTVNDSASHPDD